MKRFLMLALSLALAGLSFSQEGIQDNNSMEAMAGKPPRDPAGLEIFRRAYPDVFFNAIYLLRNHINVDKILLWLILCFNSNRIIGH